MQIRFAGCDDDGWYFVNDQFVGESHDWDAQPMFDIKKFLHVGDNVIAVGVKNGGGRGGLKPDVNLEIISQPTRVPWSRSLFNGLAQIIVQSTRDAGRNQADRQRRGARAGHVRFANQTVCAMRIKAISVCAVVLVSASLCGAQPYFVSPAGDDANPGTLEKPFATLQRAQQAARQKRGDVFLRGGTYYLPAPLVFTAQDSGTKDAPVVFQNYPGEKPVISGGVRLENLDWQPYTNGIFQANVPADLQTEEIFINGERQILARYPNFDPKAQYFDGFAADAISEQRAARWADPAGGYYHAMHPALWGDFTWRITGKDTNGQVTLEGGWQNNRGAAAHRDIRFVENIFEELDAPGEWFLEFQNAHALFLSARRTRSEKRGRGSHAAADAG